MQRYYIEIKVTRGKKKTDFECAHIYKLIYELWQNAYINCLYHCVVYTTYISYSQTRFHADKVRANLLIKLKLH